MTKSKVASIIDNMAAFMGEDRSTFVSETHKFLDELRIEQDEIQKERHDSHPSTKDSRDPSE